MTDMSGLDEPRFDAQRNDGGVHSHLLQSIHEKPYKSILVPSGLREIHALYRDRAVRMTKNTLETLRLSLMFSQANDEILDEALTRALERGRIGDLIGKFKAGVELQRRPEFKPWIMIAE